MSTDRRPSDRPDSDPHIQSLLRTLQALTPPAPLFKDLTRTDQCFKSHRPATAASCRTWFPTPDRDR